MKIKKSNFLKNLKQSSSQKSLKKLKTRNQKKQIIKNFHN